MHLCPAAEDKRNFFDRLELKLASFVVNQVGILQLVILLVEIGETDPYFRSSASAFLRVYSLDCFCKCLNRQVGVLFAQLDTTEPFVHIVWVLTQNDI